MATASFREVELIFQRALESDNDLEIAFASHGAAVNMRQRLNSWRMKVRRDSFTIYPADHPLHGATAYDGLSMRIPSADSPDANCIYISKRKESAAFEIRELVPPGQSPKQNGPDDPVIEGIISEGDDTK